MFVFFYTFFRLQSTLQGWIRKLNVKSVKSEGSSQAAMVLQKSVLVILSFQLRVRTGHGAIVSWVFCGQRLHSLTGWYDSLLSSQLFWFRLWQTVSVTCLVGYAKRNADKRCERVALETFNNFYVRGLDTSSEMYTTSSQWFDDFIQTNFCCLQLGGWARW